MDKKTEKKPSDLKCLFSYAGNFRFLTVASIILSAVSAVMARAPFLKDSPIILMDEATASCIYTQKGNKKIRKPQAANQTALIFDRRAAARLLSINSIRRLCWS